MKYITKGDIIIFDPSFNEELDPSLLTNYKRIIFSNYILKYNLFEGYENTHVCKLYSSSQFNHTINNLPPNLTHLTFGRSFDRTVDNLPPNLTHLTFGLDFNHPIDSLPPKITHLTLGIRFNQPINNLPLL